MERTYTFGELITNLRNAQEPIGTPLDDPTLGWAMCAIFGLPATNQEEAEAAYAEFERMCIEAGL